MFYEVTGERAIGRDGAERSHPVRIEYGDFGETSQVVRELTQVQRYQAKLRIDFTAVNESMEFTDLVAITKDGFVSSGKGSPLKICSVKIQEIHLLHHFLLALLDTS